MDRYEMFKLAFNPREHADSTKKDSSNTQTQPKTPEAKAPQIDSATKAPQIETTKKITDPVTGQTEETTTKTTGAPERTGGLSGFISGVKETVDNVVDNGKALVEKAPAAIQGWQQHTDLLANNEAYRAGFNNPNDAHYITPSVFNNEEWKKLITDEERTAYVTKLFQDWAYSKAGAATRTAFDTKDFSNAPTGSQEEYAKQLMADDANWKEFEAAFGGSDMTFIQYAQRMRDASGSEEGAKTAMAQLWAQLPDEKKEQVTKTLQSAVWTNLKADFFGSLPKVIGLWFREQGWNDMAGFVENPLYFYTTVLATLGAGGMLLGATQEPEQPVININNSGQSNPFWNEDRW